MKPNLDTLKDSMLEQLQAQGFAVFHGLCRHGESHPMAWWDTRRQPEFQTVLAAARQAGATLIVFSHLEFFEAMVEDALDQLEDCELPAAERRTIELRLREMQGYLGFTCALELSFDHGGRAYVYEVRAEWYTEFLRILEDIDALEPDDDEDEEEDSTGEFFSRN
jgi:hypothetical protein